MIEFIAVLIAWSLLMICLDLKITGKHYDNRIENLKRSRDFHKDQREMFVEQAKTIFEENNNLKERNLQLINENKKLKKELDKQEKVRYNYYINK